MNRDAEGVVLRHEGTQVIVDVGGEEVGCTVRKTLRREAGRRGKAVAVGDRVRIERGGEGAAVVEVSPRRSEISRRDPGDARRELVLVANVDSVLVVASAREPDFAPGLIDRFFVEAECRDLRTALVVNKVELDPGRSFEPHVRTYRTLGYEVFETSARERRGLEPVRAWLAGHTTTMLGHSGVGKSSVANALDPSLTLRTGDVNPVSGRGTHTTTTVALLRLPWGGYLVDTPGIREFGLVGIEPADLALWFREMAARADDCRFNDCLHEREPGCAIKAARDAGEIEPWRYESYLRILTDLRTETPEPY